MMTQISLLELKISDNLHRVLIYMYRLACRELAYVMQDAGISAVLASDCKTGSVAALAQEMGVPVHVRPDSITIIATL